MSDNTEDVRTKISREEHAVLAAYCRAHDVEIQEFVRQLIRDRLAEIVRVARMVSSVPGSEGLVAQNGARRGKASFCLADPEPTGGE
jgi:hypothetical protein